MAPQPPPGPGPQRVEKDKRINAIISFATNLQSQLPAQCSLPPESLLFNDLLKRIATFPSPKSFGASSASRCEEIDSNGTTLWNLCTRLRRNFEDHPQPAILLVARVFAFLLLDCAMVIGNATTANVVRLMKIGIKAAKNCLATKQLHHALEVLEKLGGYEIMLKKPDATAMPEDKELHQRLMAEYYVLRTSLAWYNQQLDVAEHMFKKSIASKDYFDPNTAESLADVLYEMGKDLLSKQQYQIALKWLDRAGEVLGGQALDRLCMDATELRTSITESRIKGLLGLKDPAATEKARDMVDELEQENGDKLIVLLLRLELLSSATNEVFDSTSHSDILRRMTLSMQLTESNFKLIMYHIRKLKDKSPSLACRALDELIQLRILRVGDNEGWVEKAVVTRLWMAVGQRDIPESLSTLEAVLSAVVASLEKPISSAATQAAHTLLWKKIESSYSGGQYEDAEKWCRLSLHKLFENSGVFNLARISRKLLLCALARQDFNAARDIFGSMSEMAQGEPMTRFLMYKVAMRCDELDFAADCLKVISSAATEDPTLLYACVLDAQHLGNKRQALLALQLVLEKQDYGAPSTVNLPSLLRVTIQFSVSVLEESLKAGGDHEVESIVERLCKLFEGGLASMHKAPSPATATLWTVPELDWFSKNSYNLAITNVSTWHPRHLLRMLVCCISYIDHFPADINGQVTEDLSLRKMFCEFSATTTLVALARGEDNIEIQLQDYLNLRKHVDAFDSLLQGKLDKLEHEPSQDLLQKLAVLLGFDFEAACHLKAWDGFGEIILKTEICKSEKVYEVMADCILSSQAPTQVVVQTMKKIVNQAWALETLDIVKLTKYMRCLFQISLSGNPDVAEQLLEQAHSLAEEAAETEQPYPAEELEWIATRAFNHAVDLYVSEEDNSCQSWFTKALNIAQFCTDDGLLELFQNKYAGLNFDAK